MAIEDENIENFYIDGTDLVRKIIRRSGSGVTSRVPVLSTQDLENKNLHELYDESWLRMKNRPNTELTTESINIADLFSGCGGLSLGVWEACRALGINPRFSFACDLNEAALSVYEKNFSPDFSLNESIEKHINGELGAPLTVEEQRIKDKVKKIDFILAGPPCQGHSDLNNHTRRKDPRNALLMRVSRVIELFQPSSVLVENVPGIIHDKSGSFKEFKNHLKTQGYYFDEIVLNAEKLGVSQARRRYFIFASKTPVSSLNQINEFYSTNSRPISWAISDLVENVGDDIFNTASEHSLENKRRIEYLFENNLFELPNSERPDCHRLKPHSYKSVYGRMYWDRPAPTITRGFGSTGQGRFVHSLLKRTITPHEAARIQFFPDFFNFGDLRRRQYQDVIGNAVPSKLSYLLALHQLR